ncbi:hypothetical protein GCM10028807_01510 [Spirosoma daeguense]
MGTTAGQNNSGHSNVFLGTYTGFKNTTGNDNIFLGSWTGHNNTGGTNNVFLGQFAGYNSTSGNGNTFIGRSAGYRNDVGNGNIFLGSSAGFNNTLGKNNISIGEISGQGIVSGNNNIILGYESGGNLTTGNNNVMLGTGTNVPINNIKNAVAIGANARVALDNAIVLGDPYNTSIAVGIGTDSPQFPLDVRGIINLRNNGTIKFSHLSNPLRNGTTDQFLTVDEQGETVLAKHRLRIENVNQWSDKVFSAMYSLRPLSSVATYIQQHGHLPGVPSAEDVVKEGVDLVKMNATLLEKVEELTLYSIEQDKKADRQQKEINELKTLIKQLLEKK